MQAIYRGPRWRRYAPAALVTALAALGALIVAGMFDVGTGSRIYGWAIIAAALVRIPAILLNARGSWVRVSDDGIHVRIARIRKGVPERISTAFIRWSDIREITVESVGEGHRDGVRYPALVLPDGSTRPLRILASALRPSRHPARIFNPREAMYDPRFDAKIANMRAHLARVQDTPATH